MIWGLLKIVRKYLHLLLAMVTFVLVLVFHFLVYFVKVFGGSVCFEG